MKTLSLHKCAEFPWGTNHISVVFLSWHFFVPLKWFQQPVEHGPLSPQYWLKSAMRVSTKKKHITPWIGIMLTFGVNRLQFVQVYTVQIECGLVQQLLVVVVVLLLLRLQPPPQQLLLRLSPLLLISHTESYRNLQQSYQTIQLSYRTRKFHLEWSLFAPVRSSVHWNGTYPNLKTFLCFFNYRRFRGAEAPEGCENVA